MSFFAVSMTLPLSLLLVYGLGMLTGGVVLSLVRTWVQAATRKPPGLG